MKNFQVAIIGGGVTGSSIAWELSKYKIKTAVIEKGIDVCSGASKANSGVIHSGINSPVNSLKALYCVQGNQMFQELADKLGFSLKWVGKYVIAKNEKEIKELKKLKKTGIKNKVPNLKILDAPEITKNEPNVCCKAGLWVPTAGIILPYEFTICLAENAVINGVNYFLETQVVDIEKQKDGFSIKTNQGDFKSSIVINAAGLNCDDVVSMLEKPDFKVYPCRGEYLVLDKKYNNLINSMIYPLPEKEKGVLGVHITPTIEGNILLGPSAEFIDNPYDKRTTRQTMNNLFTKAKEIVPSLPKKAVINAYAGIRCKIAPEEEGGWADYKIQESKINPGFINLAGIESPGLTSAPAIAKEIINMISKKFELEKDPNFKLKKKARRFIDLSFSEQSDLIKSDPRWGRVVCRCEHVTEAEVIKALSNPLGAQGFSSVKYRCRAGMGRCQGGFCTQHIARIMQEEFYINVDDIKMSNPNSKMFFGRTRGGKQ